MATTVGSHSVSTFATPVNGGPLDANVVRGNDNTIRSAYVAHDADTGIHVQSSTLANRPAAGTAGRKWITADTGIFKLWYDDGTTWHEVGTSTIDVYVLADENLVKGDIVKVTGYNVGNGAPRVAKVSSAADTAFGIVNGTIAANAVGYVTNTGLIIDLNTNAFAIGDILYPNTSGGLTTTKPTSGNYQPSAFVLRSNSNNGVLYVEFSAPRIVERSDNTVSTVVLRDGSGNFAAGTITAGALTSTGLVTFASLKGSGATTVTDILNDGTMATASATTLATSASIKTYVDTQIGANNDLSEVLANGNTTDANDIIVTAGQKITTDTIAETSSGFGVTIDSVLLKDNEVTATGVRVSDIKANNGTAAGSISGTGVVTLGSSVLTTTDINGGTVDGTTIGASVPAAATFTNITSAGTINLTGATVSNGGSVTTIDINGGTIDGTTIGGNSAAAGTFTTINATSINATTFDMTNLEVTNIKAKDGTASMTIADTTGNVTVSAALVANGNVTLGNATSDTITVGGSFPTGTKLRTDSGVGNTLAVSAYDVDGTAYVDLITATASNTPTLALTSTGVGSMNNIAIGASTAASGAFTTLGSSGDFAVATNKFTVASATGNTAVAGTLTTEDTLTSNGNTVLGSAATDTITATAQFVTGTQLKSAQSANNTLALSAYDVDGTAYVDLVKLTAGNTPTLTLTSTGVGSLDNITIGGSTAAAGSFTSLSASGNFTLGADVVLSRGAANRLDLASGDSLNVVSGDIQIGGSTVISSTSVGTLSSLTVSGDLTVDTDTLKVDSANNRVGIGTASPEAPLHLQQSASGSKVTLYVDNSAAAASGNAASVKFSLDSGATVSNGGAEVEALIENAGNGAALLRFLTYNGSAYAERMRLDASGNLGLGVTPSAWVDSRAFQIANTSASPIIGGVYALENNGQGLVSNAYYDGTNWKYIYGSSFEAARYELNSGQHRWFYAAAGTSPNTASFTQAMTLDASGNLLLGATANIASTRQELVMRGANGAVVSLGNNTDADRFQLASDSGSNALINNKANTPMIFYTNATERARITSGGYFKASNTGTYNDATGAYHELSTDSSGNFIVRTRNTASSNPFGIRIDYTAAAPNGAGNQFLFCADNAATRAEIYSNGGLGNYSANNVNLASDERLKKDIAPLASTWDKLKAIEVVNFRYKDCNEDDPALYGVIAQQVQPIVPELVVVTREAVEAKDAVLDEDGNEVEPAVEAAPEYYGIREQPMYWLAIKALQEAQARIEALEARLEALEA